MAPPHDRFALLLPLSPRERSSSSGPTGAESASAIVGHGPGKPQGRKGGEDTETFGSLLVPSALAAPSRPAPRHKHELFENCAR